MWVLYTLYWVIDITLAYRELGYDLSEVERNHLKTRHVDDDSSESEIEIQEVWLTHMPFIWFHVDL